MKLKGFKKSDGSIAKIYTDPTLTESDSPADAASVKAKDDLLQQGITNNANYAAGLNTRLSELENGAPSIIAPKVTEWLEDNVNPVGSAVTVDSSLTVAGSAADAKKTGDEISDLKSDLSDITQTNYTDVEDCNVTITQGYVYPNGTIVESTGYYYSSKVAVEQGDKIYLRQSASAANRTMIVVVAYSGDTAVESKSAQNVTEYEVPVGVNYVRVVSSTSFSQDSLHVYRSTTYLTIETDKTLTLSDVPADAKATGERLTALENDNSILKNQFAFSSVELTWNEGYLLSVNGALTQFSSPWAVTDPVDISAYSTVKVKASTGYNNLFYALYDTNNVFIRGQIAEGNPSNYSGTVDIDGAKYIRVSRYLSGSMSDGEVSVPSGLIGIKDWTQKKWVVIGDSLTQNNQTTTKHYFDYIIEETGISVVNMGVGGTGYANPNGTAGNFVDRMASVPTDADVYTIFGSFNDYTYNDLPIGSATDSGTATLCGYINAAFDALFARVPLANLGVIAPCPWVSINQVTSSGTFGKDYCDALKACCERRSIPFMNLYTESGLRPWDSDFVSLAYTKDAAHGVHPDETGHAILAPKFEAFLDKLLLH